MPRKSLQRSNQYPYHVTARANNKEVFHLPLEVLWRIIESECQSLSLLYGTQFHSVVLMPNHLHMVLTVPEHDLGIIMNLFMTNVTKKSNKSSGRSGHIFGGPYYWSIILSERYFMHALKYVYRNPVKANLVEHADNYFFSTLYGLVGNQRLEFPIYFSNLSSDFQCLLSDTKELLNWIDIPFPAEAERLIQMGLRKRTFAQLKQRFRRKTDLLDLHL